MNGTEARELAVWVGLVQTLWLLGLSVTLWLRKPGTQAQESVRSLQESMAAQTASLTGTMLRQHSDLDQRLKAVETDMKHMPTSEEMARLDGTVRVVGEQARSMAISMDGLRGQMARIETYLMTQPKGGDR